MNAQQREYLVKKVQETFKKQKDELDENVPDEPSMNRHFIAAFLDGSAVIYPADKIKELLTAHVKELGSSDFVEQESSYRYRQRRKYYGDDDEYFQFIKIDPRMIMEEPLSFKEAFAAWKAKRDEADAKIKDLQQQLDLLVLKIQIGSNLVLDKLIAQVDSLGDLNLFSNRLTLIAEGLEASAGKLLKEPGKKKGQV